MAILDFQKPDKVIMNHSDEFSGEFEFRPLEPGYGITIGNSLRRRTTTETKERNGLKRREETSYP